MDFSDVFFVSEENKFRMTRANNLERGLYLQTRITYFCNLNCAYCVACSPLADEGYMDFDVFKRDLKQVKPLFEKENGRRMFRSYCLCGGETLLHPQIMEFAEFARGELPEDVPIFISTNGLLLQSMSEDKISHFAKLGVVMNLTDYVIKDLDLNGYFTLAKRHGLKTRHKSIKPRTDIKVDVISFAWKPLMEDKSVPFYEYLWCNQHNKKNCATLQDGKLGICSKIFASKLLNDSFGTSFEVTEDDYVDIYKAERKEIEEYFKKRIPFCGYCNISGAQSVAWKRSEKKKEEWI
jgi:organic radical activating enzyme